MEWTPGDDGKTMGDLHCLDFHTKWKRRQSTAKKKRSELTKPEKDGLWPNSGVANFSLQLAETAIHVFVEGRTKN
jgi:hypothetical protein